LHDDDDDDDDDELNMKFILYSQQCLGKDIQ